MHQQVHQLPFLKYYLFDGGLDSAEHLIDAVFGYVFLNNQGRPYR